MNRVLIDTSAWIEAFSRKGRDKIKKVVDELIKDNRLAICDLIKVELLQGVKSEDAFEELRLELETLYDLIMDKKTWDEAARLAYSLRRKGKTVPLIDVLIASMAIRHALPLLHQDRHFDTIASISSLNIYKFER